MRYALYARYSSNNQSDASIEDQFRQCRDKVASLNGTVIEEYSDHAISGASTINRQRLNDLISDAKNHKFDAVLTEDLSRLSRNLKDMAGIYEELKFRNIKLITLSDGKISDIHVGLKGTMNAIYLTDLAEKTKRGQIGRVNAGKIAGGLSYGYDKIFEFDDKGKPVNGERKINDFQAEIIKRIFEEYIDGLSAKKIAKNLNADGIPSPSGKLWNASTINGSRSRRNGILHNQLYIGRIVYGRQSFKKDPSTGKRKATLNPESKWTVTEVPNFRIIPEVIWNQLQAIKDKNSGMAVNKCRRPVRLLSGIIKCGVCGGGYTVTGKNRYGCSAFREKGTCTNNKTISTDILEGRVLAGLKKHLMEPDMLAEYIKTYHATMKRLRGQQVGERRSKERELNEISVKINRIVDAIVDGFASEEMKPKLTEMSNRKTHLIKEMQVAEEPNVVEMHPNLPEVYQSRIDALHEALNHEDSRQKAATILRTLIDKIVIHPKPKRGEFDIEFHGDIAALLHLLQNKGGTSGKDVMKWMVAGARYPLFRTPISSFIPTVRLT
jgi:site-specific DNA recombinase